MELFTKKKSLDELEPDIPITVEGGLLDRGQRLRSVAALFPDGKFLVSKSHFNSALISSFIEEAKLYGFEELDIHQVDIADITAAYSGAGGFASFSKDEARMRREVIDLIAKVSQRKASDIHVIVGPDSCLVKARIDRMMTDIAEWPAEFGHSFCAAAFTMADASDVNYQPYEYQAARVSNRDDLKLPDGVTSLRLQFNPIVYGGRALIIRLLYDSGDQKLGDVAGLGFSPEQMEDLETIRSKPFGINIVAGPTGHGKSTTLLRNVSLIIEESNYKVAFYTVEDPPEYNIPGAVQMPVTNAATQEERSEAFTKAIAASLRSNPDRIMIGEVRDGASAGLAFEAAMTGHQVWTTLHSNDAVTIPFRMRDLGVEDFKLCDPSLLTGMMSQRLVRKTCTNCATSVLSPDDIDYNLYARLETAGIDIESVRLHNPKGCEKCGEGNGYAGLTIVAEIIIPDEKFMDFVKEDDKVAAEEYWLKHLNGRNMVEHMIDRVKHGEIDPFVAESTVGPLIRPTR